MVEILDPDENDMVLDPACGNGGFLVVVLDHVRRKIARELFPDEEGVLLEDKVNDPRVTERARKYAGEKLFGFDFDDELKKAARMNMVMSGDGHKSIFSLNSLEYPAGMYDDIQPLELKVAESLSVYDPKGMDLFGRFDLIFTNPPFGTKIPVDDPGILMKFDLGHRWVKDENSRRQK